jgi:soluble lytic murein transglycosylase-like protein
VFANKKKLIGLAVLGTLAGITATQALGAPERVHARLPASVQAEVHNRVTDLSKRIKRHKAHTAKEAASTSGAASPESYGVTQSTLDAIASCESGGDPTAVSAGGIYRGLYQFDQGTWESVGGSGDPAAAPPAEQSMRAAMLYSQSGSSPWPVCG